MKKVSLLIIMFVSILLFIQSCKKDEEDTKVIKTYTLNFEASHRVSEENQFADPYAYYCWSVEDENNNSKYNVSDYVKRTTVKGTTTAKTGDWIWVYISVNDAFDIGTVSCKSTDGSIFLFETTDNMYIDESDGITAKSVIINGMDTIIKVRKEGFQIK